MKKILYVISLVFILMLFGAGYSIHTLSEETQFSITGILGNDPLRNWTAPNATETVNFTVKNNGSSNDPIVSINITLPGGFALINTTINNSLYTDWSCSNTSSSMIYCINNTSPGLGNGSSVDIWFNVTSSESVENEQNYLWKINTTDNETNESGTVLVSWIDGNVTVTAEPDALLGYMKVQPFLNWTAHNGSDAVSGLLNYTIYHSSDGGNFTVNGTTSDTYYQTNGLSVNQNHSFVIETRDRAGNARNSSLVYTIIDTVPPVIALNTSDNANFTVYYPSLYFNVTDNFDSNMSCELFIDGNGNGTGFAANGSAGQSITANTSLTGAHTWHVNCTDDADNTGTSIQRTLNVDGADIVVENVYYNGSSSSNLVDDSDITVYADVKNDGNRNIMNNVTVTFFLDGTSIGTATILNDTLAAGENATVNVVRNASLKQYLPDSFNHTLKATAAVSDTELSTNNNEKYNYSLYVGYNVTITSIDASLTPGNNLSITVRVEYPDGSGVTSLDKRNFTISDMYSGQTTHTWGGLSLAKPIGTQNVYNDSFSESGGGVYTFKIATYNLTTITEGGTTRGGEHTAKVDVQSDMTGKLFTGAGPETYNLTAPMFDIIYKIRGDPTDLNGDTNLDESSNEDFNIYVVNNGYANLTDVNISVQSFESTVFSAVTPNSCSPSTTVVNDGSQVLICYISVTTKEVDANDGGQIDIIAYGSYNGNKYTYDNDDLYIDVSNDGTTTTQQQTTNAASTGATDDTDYPNCVQNDDCFADEFCNDHYICKALDCSSDEKTVDHECVKKEITTEDVVSKDYALIFTGGPENLEIEHGESRNITFNIKNDGEKTLTDLKFELKLKEDSVDVSKSYQIISEYSKTPEKGDTVSVTLLINTSDFSIGNYEMIAYAESNETKADMTFTMKILPNDDEKVQINNTNIKLNSDYDELFDRLQVMLHKYQNNTNLTELNSTIAIVKEQLDKAKKAISDGDYFSAYEDQMSAESLMIDIKSRLDEEGIDGSETESHWIRNGAIVIILIIAGLFGFQYYNENQRAAARSGYHPQRGFRIKERRGRFNQNLLRDIGALKMMIKGKNRPKSVKPSVEFKYGNYGTAFYYNKRNEGLVKRIKGMFTGRRRNTNQKTLYDISSVYNKDKKKKESDILMNATGDL